MNRGWGLARLAEPLHRHRALVLPAALAGLLLVVLVPLPPGLMDVLVVANLALAALILLTTLLASSSLEFSLFPSVLLLASLVRLVLNVGLTRLILSAGQAGPGWPQAQRAAGAVVWAMGDLVAGGSPAVGLALLGVLVAVQIIVVIKGAGRISEVAARFALDAMPGRQMSIDSDLSAGLIGPEEVRRRRSELDRQAEFCGAMDGASRFLRGDAVAAIVICLVNLLGGLYVAVAEHGWSWSPAAETFSLLAVGAGVAMQVPALLVAAAAAILVTRSSSAGELGLEVPRQLSRRPVALALAAALVGAMMLTSLPKLPVLMIAAALAGAATLLAGRPRPTEPADASAPLARAAPPKAQEPDRLPAVDPLRIRVGYGLVSLVDPQRQGDLLGRIGALRAKLAEELGLPVPPVRIRDDMRLDAHGYVIEVRDAKVAEGQVYPGWLLAVGAEAGELIGRQTRDPVFGAPAVWIRPEQRSQAEAMGFAVVAPGAVLATHLDEALRRHGPELLTRQQVARLLEALGEWAPNLRKEVDSRLTAGQVQKVLQALLRERAPIRDLETILEAALEGAERGEDPAAMAERARAALGRRLGQAYCSDDGRLWCVSLDPGLEESIGRYVSQGDGVAAVPPELEGKLARAVRQGVQRLADQGRQPVVVCSPSVRLAVRRLLAGSLPDAAVLGYNELDSVPVETVATIGTEP